MKYTAIYVFSFCIPSTQIYKKGTRVKALILILKKLYPKKLFCVKEMLLYLSTI